MFVNVPTDTGVIGIRRIFVSGHSCVAEAEYLDGKLSEEIENKIAFINDGEMIYGVKGRRCEQEQGRIL